MSGLVYDRSKCDLCRKCIDICPFGALSIAEDSIEISSECRMCLQCVRACPRHALTAPAKSVAKKEAGRVKATVLSDYSGVMVFAQFDGDRFNPVTFELLGKGLELARKVGQSVVCVAVGNGVGDHGSELLKYGANRVLIYDHPSLEHFLADVYADVMEDAVVREKPGTVLIGATPLGRSLAPRLAVRLRTGLTADCTILDMMPNGNLVQTRPAFGGNIMATILTPNDRPQMATVRYKVMEPAELVAEPKGSVVTVASAVGRLADSIAAKMRNEEVLSSRVAPPAESIADAKVIVAAGRGLRGPQDIPLLEELASKLGGVVGCTRPLVEKGWFPPSRQIGLSGRTVRPRLYVACGVSGAVQHVAGMSDSSIIVAINMDKDAPIFDTAHYGVVGDLYEIIPALVNAVS